MQELALSRVHLSCLKGFQWQLICNLPPITGKCKASLLRFYFNTATGNCEGFIYGGCGGNKNNFKALGQCRATCQRSGKEEISSFASAHH
uniref:BPTI/Kunitz inhibitor domain-containing protein n=1 Tax=Pseudonaja textilis TaxID=8673 RepID=A0A670Z4I4_PSETE